MINFTKQKIAVLVIHKATNYALIALIFAAVLSYMYFANITVRTLTSLEKTRVQMLSLGTEMSEMESKRLTIENSVSTEKALHLGFVEVNNPTFIIKSSKKAVLSLKID